MCGKKRKSYYKYHSLISTFKGHLSHFQEKQIRRQTRRCYPIARVATALSTTHLQALTNSRLGSTCALTFRFKQVQTEWPVVWIPYFEPDPFARGKASCKYIRGNNVHVIIIEVVFTPWDTSAIGNMCFLQCNKWLLLQVFRGWIPYWQTSLLIVHAACCRCCYRGDLEHDLDWTRSRVGASCFLLVLAPVISYWTYSKGRGRKEEDEGTEDEGTEEERKEKGAIHRLLDSCWKKTVLVCCGATFDFAPRTLLFLLPLPPISSRPSTTSRRMFAKGHWRILITDTVTPKKHKKYSCQRRLQKTTWKTLTRPHQNHYFPINFFLDMDFSDSYYYEDL
jgi:hypothetical protein